MRISPAQARIRLPGPRALAHALKASIVLMVVLALGVPLGIGTPRAMADPAPKPVAAPHEPANAAEARMSLKLDKRLRNRALGTDVTIAVLDEATNRLIVNRGATVPQLPASNMKVITAVAALAALGPNRRFSTRVLAGSRPNEVILQGGGDPLLTDRDLRRLARLTAARLPRGRTIVLRIDDHLFAGPLRAPGWPRSYLGSVAAPVRSLARLGDYSTANQARAVAVFRRALARRGFTVVLRSGRRAPVDARVLAQVSRHDVRRAVKLMLSESENNVAEVLFRHVALASGEPGTWAGGRQAVTSLLATLGFDTTRLRLMDGSGLSRANRVTALALAQLARLSRLDPRFATMYERGAMPVSGRSGTLDDRYGRYSTRPSRCARGKIRAKTGTLFDTVGLTGITIGGDGQEKSFAILVNHRPQRVSTLTTRRAVDGLAATINGCW